MNIGQITPGEIYRDGMKPFLVDEVVRKKPLSYEKRARTVLRGRYGTVSRNEEGFTIEWDEGMVEIPPSELEDPWKDENVEKFYKRQQSIANQNWQRSESARLVEELLKAGIPADSSYISTPRGRGREFDELFEDVHYGVTVPVEYAERLLPQKEIEG